MKAQFRLICVVLIASTLVVDALVLLPKPALLKAWNIYLKSFEKEYQTIAERTQRFDLFVKNYELIVSHNEKFKSGLESFQMAVNRFTDMVSACLLYTSRRG